jgi:hypothetical protein
MRRAIVVVLSLSALGSDRDALANDDCGRLLKIARIQPDDGMEILRIRSVL